MRKFFVSRLAIFVPMLWAGMALLMIFPPAYGQGQGFAKSPTLTAPSGRYQLLTAVVNEPTESGGFADFHEVFLLDTETGKVWMYGHGLAFKGKDEKINYLPSYFSAVPVDGLTGDVEQQQFQAVMSINSAKKKASEANSEQPPPALPIPK